MKLIAFAIAVFTLVAPLSAETLESQLFQQYCVTCHGADKQKGDVRLDQLNTDFYADEDFLETLIGVLKRSEMPPPKRAQPADEMRAAVVNQLQQRLRKDASPSMLKRLTREEYTNTINDLLDTQFNLDEFLPEDASGDSFNKVGESHLMSPNQVQAYLQTARFVAEQLVLEEKPVEREWIFGRQHFRGSTRGDYQTDEAHVLTTNYPWRSNLHFVTSQEDDELFEVPEFGRYRFEADVTIANSEEDQTVGFNAGDPRYPTNLQKIARVVLPHDAKSFSMDLTLPQGTQVTFTFDSAATWTIGGGVESYRKYAGPKLIFTKVKVTGPIYEQWPTPAEKRLFGDTPNDVDALARHLVTLFTNRKLPDDDLAALTRIAQQTLDAGGSYKLAGRRLITAILSSPYFIYKYEPSTLDDVALAYRLSYFLWNSVPDAELLRSATAGELQSRELLRKQVDRMLASPKIDRFCEDFTRQWLQTDKIDDVAPDDRLFGNVTALQVNALASEAHAFFREILEKNLSMTNFIDSEFVMVNDLSAEFYGFERVDGRAFRPLMLPSDCERGGLIGQAGILKLTSGSFRTSPILRGVWILKNLYGEKLEPPADLKIEEPDIRGATTMKEVMAKHQSSETCHRCHAKIDPLGLALEHYDPVGRWRDEYTHVEVSQTSNDNKTINATNMPIDSEAALADGRRLDSMTSLKRILMDDKEIVLKGIISKLITYSTGRESSWQDEEFVNDIYRQIEGHDYSLQLAIRGIATHPAFRRK